MGEAYWTSQITTVCDVYDGQDSMGFVLRTNTTIIWAALVHPGSWVDELGPDVIVALSSLIFLVVAPIEVAVLSMFGARLIDVYFCVFFVYSCWNYL